MARRRFRAVGRPGKLRRAGEGPLYSAFRLYTTAGVPAAVIVAAQDARMFTTKVGAEGQNWGAGNPLSYNETNMENAGRIPDEQSFRIREIGVAIYSGVGLAAAQDSTTAVIPDNAQVALLMATHLRIDTPQWKQVFGPVWFWPAGVGPDESGLAWNGQRTLTAARKLRRKVLLKAGQTLAWIATFPRATTVAAADQVANQAVAIMIRMYGSWEEKVA